MCMIDNTQWIGHDHPYHDLPELVCHIAPPYAVINAGPKCIGLDLHQVARDYHQSETSDSQMELKDQLELLRDIWALFENVKEVAKAWEKIQREESWKKKRKRDKDDTDTYSMRTTRSQSRSANGGHGSHPGPSRPASRSSRHTEGSNTQRRSS